MRYDRLLDPAAKLAAESLQKKDALGQDQVRAAAELSAEACRLLADGSARPAGAQKPAETRYKLADQAVQLGEQAFPGRIFKLSLEGKVLGVYGRGGRLAGQFGGVHQMACPSENEIYTAENFTWRTQKLVIKK